MGFKVAIANAGASVDCAHDCTVLTAAIKAGIDFPYGCATGNCGTCLAELKRGEVELLPYADGALSQRQKSAGLTLACRALPRSDLELIWLGPPLTA